MRLELWVFVCREVHFLADRRLDLAKNELWFELKFACNSLLPQRGEYHSHTQTHTTKQFTGILSSRKAVVPRIDIMQHPMNQIISHTIQGSPKTVTIVIHNT